MDTITGEKMPLEQLVTENNCWWPWSHKWSKWETFSEGTIRMSTDALGIPVQPGTGIATGRYEFQRRVCKNCGKSQLRKVEAE
jgi:hypothetical protein